MGQIGHGLDDLLVGRAVNFIQQNGEHQRRGEDDGQRQQVQRQGVFDVLPQIGAGQKALEPFQADVLGAFKALEQLVIVEGGPQEVHGHVLEKDHVHQYRDDHQVDVAVLPDPICHVLAGGGKAGSGLLNFDGTQGKGSFPYEK